MKDYSIDGIILFSSRTCRIYGVGLYDMAQEIEQQLKLPTVVIEGDHCDPQHYSHAQIETRLHAFIETLEARKGPK